MNVLFRAYNRLHQNTRFNYLPDGGNAGVRTSRPAGVCSRSTRDRRSRATRGTTYFKLWLDGLCIAVNPSNSVSNLTIAQTKNIFTGVATNWSQGFGSNLTSTIDPVGRNSTAGLYTFFQQAVLGGATQSSNVQQVTSDGLVATAVSKDPNAIGYVGIAHTGKGSGVKSLDVNGVPCNQANIKSENYPLFRYAWGVLPTSHPSQAVEKFFDWIRTSKQAGQIINRGGAVAAFNKK